MHLNRIKQQKSAMKTYWFGITIYLCGEHINEIIQDPTKMTYVTKSQNGPYFYFFAKSN